jgi:hypothetical protein
MPRASSKRPASRAKPSQKTAKKRSSPTISTPDHPLKENRPMAEPSSKASPAAPAPAAGAADRQPAQIRYLDNADMAETFADSITGLIFDGQTLRIEFGVTRFDEVRPNTQVTGRRYPACRLVLPPAAAVELINRMQQIATALTQAGVVRANPRPGAEAKAD